MSRIPNLGLREVLTLGCRSTLGVHDWASPDNSMLPLLTPGPIDQNCMCSADRPLVAIDVCREEILPTGLLWQLINASSSNYKLPAVATNRSPITEADYQRAANELKCELNAIRAVAEVESQGEGFFNDGRPKILFEAHYFARLSENRYNKDYPHISKKWTNKDEMKKLYKGGPAEYQRLEEAIGLDWKAALQSASWGKFQVMGENYSGLGYASIEVFVSSMFQSESEHLESFVRFVKWKKGPSGACIDHLRNKNWLGFAKVYNGEKQDGYDTRMALAYAHLNGTIMAAVGEGGKNHKSDVVVVQQALKQAGLMTEKATGTYGPATKRAIGQLKEFAGGVIPAGTTTEAIVKAAKAAVEAEQSAAKAARNAGKLYKSVGVGGDNLPEDVTMVQKALAEAKLFAGPQNGKFGPMTTTALKQVKFDKDLIPAGTATADVLKAATAAAKPVKK